MKKAKKGLTEALTKNIGIKLSEQDRQDLTRMAEEENMSITEFVRQSIQQRINNIELADTINSVINAGIHRIEEVARLSKVNQEILEKVKNLEEKVALKKDFEEHKNDVTAKVNGIKAAFDDAFVGLGTDFKTLIKAIQNTVANNQATLFTKLNSLDYAQKIILYKVGGTEKAPVNDAKNAEKPT